jgi:hypothetical protein
MSSAMSRTVATFGTLAGLAGVEHGVGELLQGNVAPGGIVIRSWPGSELFRILGGEPAMTLVPNLLASGILAILVSLCFLVWAARFVQRRHGGLVLILLSLILLLVGGGFGPPLFGLILGLAATRINAPLAWWRARLPNRAGHILSSLWPWLLTAALIAWLLVLPGSILLDYFVGVGDPDLMMVTLIPSAFGLLLLTIITALAADAQRQSDGALVAAERNQALV